VVHGVGVLMRMWTLRTKWILNRPETAFLESQHLRYVKNRSAGARSRMSRLSLQSEIATPSASISVTLGQQMIIIGYDGCHDESLTVTASSQMN